MATFLGKISLGGNYNVGSTAVAVQADAPPSLGGGATWFVQDAAFANSLRNATPGSAGRRVYIYSADAYSGNVIRNVGSWGLDQIGFARGVSIVEAGAGYEPAGPLVTDYVTPPTDLIATVSGGDPCNTCGSSGVPTPGGNGIESTWNWMVPDQTVITDTDSPGIPDVTTTELAEGNRLLLWLQSEAFFGLPWWVFVLLAVIVLKRKGG